MTVLFPFAMLLFPITNMSLPIRELELPLSIVLSPDTRLLSPITLLFDPLTLFPFPVIRLSSPIPTFPFPLMDFTECFSRQAQVFWTVCMNLFTQIFRIFAECWGLFLWLLAGSWLRLYYCQRMLCIANNRLVSSAVSLIPSGVLKCWISVMMCEIFPLKSVGGRFICFTTGFGQFFLGTGLNLDARAQTNNPNNRTLPNMIFLYRLVLFPRLSIRYSQKQKIINRIIHKILLRLCIIYHSQAPNTPPPFGFLACLINPPLSVLNNIANLSMFDNSEAAYTNLPWRSVYPSLQKLMEPF